MTGPCIGVDVGGTSVRAAVVDADGTVIDQRQSDTPVERTAAEAEIAGVITDLAAKHPVRAVGLAIAGFVSADMSRVMFAPHLAWRNAPVADLIAARVGLPVVMDHDVNCAAWAEHTLGAAASARVSLTVAIGTGIGAGLVVDGTLYRGAHGVAPELGHLAVIPAGRACACGNRGCLERYVSLEALRRRGIPDAQWLGEIEPVFGSAITVIENLFDPQTIILGGMAPEPLLQGLAALAERLPGSVSARSDRTAPRLLVAHGGQNSVLSGAAALAVLGTLSPRHGQMFGTASEAGAPQAGDIAA